MGLWWVMGGLALLLGAAALNDRRQQRRFSRPLPPGSSRADRRAAKRLHRAEWTAGSRASVGYGGHGDARLVDGFDGGHFGGFDGGFFGGFDGCGGGDGSGC